MILGIIWIVCGVFNFIYFIIDCIKKGEVTLRELLVVLLLAFMGIIGTGIMLNAIFDGKDPVLWKRKEK